MSQSVRWYRSASATPPVRPSVSRLVRNWLRARLPEPDVRGRTMVLYSRRTFPRPTSSGVRSDFHGLFSEFHSVLGALAYGHAHWGLTLGPVSGRLLAEMITGTAPFCDPAPFSAERFGAKR